MALVYTELTQYQKALQLHLKAMKIRQQRNDTLSIAQSLNNIGMTYHARGDWNVALSYYQKAVQMLENTPYKIALANTYNNIGQLYFSSFSDTTSYLADSAEIYFMKAYTRFSTDDNRVGIIKTLINLGNLYASKGLSEKAIDAYRAALNQQNLIADSAGKALTLFNMGILFDEMGETKRAREYLLQSLKIAENFNLGDLRRENYQQLFHLAHKENRLQEATLYASLFFAINDSLNDLSKKLLIDQFQGKFNYLDIENSQLASNLKKWQKIGIFATGIIVLSLLFLIWRRKKK
jgi:tetratricopeptide (TPR) repeat protein